MLLSSLVGKPVFVHKTVRGVCRGVALSLKTHAVKYLLCSTSATSSRADFAVAVSSVLSVDDGIVLSKLRAAVPRYCVNLFLTLPVFSDEGGYLGKIADLEIRDFIATELFTDIGKNLSVHAITACSDAVILKKELGYPLGQRVPNSVVSLLTDKPNTVVTKPVLRSAIKKGALLKLTLALPPFSLNLSSSNGVFRGQL